MGEDYGPTSRGPRQEAHRKLRSVEWFVFSFPRGSWPRPVEWTRLFVTLTQDHNKITQKKNSVVRLPQVLTETSNK